MIAAPGTPLRKKLQKLPGWKYLKLARKKTRPKKIAQEFSFHIQASRSHKLLPEKRFMLFALGRSGSELLRNLLNSHPDIYCDEEIFSSQSAIFPRDYLDNRSLLLGKKIYGYKAKPFHLDNQYLNRKIIKERFFTSDYKILYLRRKNILNQALSAIVGQMRQVWHDTAADALNGEKFIIDGEKLLSGILWNKKCHDIEKELLINLEYLPICYETDLLPEDSHQETMNRIFDYMDIERVAVKTIYHKTLPERFSDFIENFDEISAMIRKTEYAHYLDDA